MSKNKKDLFNVILDIRNSSVGIAIFKDIKNGEIVYTNRQYLFFDTVNKIDDFEKEVFKTIDQVFSDLQKKDLFKKIKINKVLCFLSSPWYESEIKNISFKETKERVFNKEYLKRKINSSEKESKKESSIIESKILSIYLNGYEVDDPYDKKFKDIRISFYKSLINNKIKEIIEDKITENLKNKEIVFHSHPLSMLTVLKKNYHSIDSFTLFDIGGEIVEISIYKEGIFEELLTVPNGFNFLVKEIAKKQQVGKNNIYSKIKLIAENELKDEKLEKEFFDISKKWLENINKIKKTSFSNNIFVTVDKDLKKIIQKIFKNSDFYTNVLNLNIEPNLRVVDSLNTQNLAFYSKEVERDPILSVLYNFSTIDFN